MMSIVLFSTVQCVKVASPFAAEQVCLMMSTVLISTVSSVKIASPCATGHVCLMMSIVFLSTVKCVKVASHLQASEDNAGITLPVSRPSTPSLSLNGNSTEKTFLVFERHCESGDLPCA